jgi:hypothetical protein
VECGDGVHPKEKCEWGEWLRVAFIPSAMVRNERGGHGGGRGKGHGRSYGRGNGGIEDSDEMYDSLNEDNDDEEDIVVEKDEKGMAAEKEEIAKQLVDQSISPLALQEKRGQGGAKGRGR